MSIVQTVYPNFHEALVAGQVADTVNCDIDSMLSLGADAIPFGYGVGLNSPPRGVAAGAGRPRVARLNGALNNSATTTNIDSEENPFSELPAGQHYLINSEIIYVSAVTATAMTFTRGALGSAVTNHGDNASILRLLGETSFRGVAIMDERLPAASGTAYQQGDPVSVMWRGDVAVPVSAAVVVGQAAVMTMESSTGDPTGVWSGRPPGLLHAFIAGARFLSPAASGEVAVLRLTGQHHTMPSI